MTMIKRLLELANKLAEDGAHSLTLKRRAVSTAYYAVFHALAKLCADEMLEDRRSSEYERIYRALDHGTLKTAFNSQPLSQIPEIKTIGNRAVMLRSERNRSDYLPSQHLYTKTQCLDLVRSARIAVAALGRWSDEHRRTLAVHLLSKNRSS